MKAGRVLHYCIYESRYAIVVVCLAYLAFSIALIQVTGLNTADATALGFESVQHLLGLMLLTSLLPTWLIGCMFITQRNSFAIASRLDAGLAERVAAIPALYIWAGFLGGLLYALAFNVPIMQFGMVLDGNGPMIGIFVGQILVWLFVGWMLAVRLYVGTQFYAYGKVVPITVFEQSRLEPFARVGMLDIAIIIGCFAISIVQSIDAQFRIQNYLTGIVVAVPAAIALLVRPMWSVHRRLLKSKRGLQAQVRRQIREAPEQGDAQAVAELEALLKRRDRVNALSTWPLDISMWSRLFFYGLIPPVAWVAAALVEVLIEQVITR